MQLHHGATGLFVFVAPEIEMSARSISPGGIVSHKNSDAFEVTFAHPSCASDFPALDATRPSGVDYVICVKPLSGSMSGPLAKRKGCLFLSPITDVTQPHRLQNSQQQITLECASCSTITEIFLGGPACDHEYSTRTRLTKIASAYQATLNSSALRPGDHYTLCVDLDGPSPFLHAGPSTFTIYLSPINTLTLKSNTTEEWTFTVNCGSGQCSKLTTLHLRQTACDTSLNGRVDKRSWQTESAMFEYDQSGIADQWRVRVRRHDRLSVAVFKVCVDVDGAHSKFTFGDTGFEQSTE